MKSLWQQEIQILFTETNLIRLVFSMIWLMANQKTAVSKNVYFDVLADIVDKSNNTVHRNIKRRPIDVTPDSYAEYNEDSNEKDPKFKVGDHVIISKYRNIFAKGYSQIWSEESFVVIKIKNTVLRTYVT